MATVNEEIVTGRKFRKLIDEATKLWQRISFWTKSSDVEFDDGENAETKVGAIKGITTDTNVTVPGYAADMTVVSELYGNIQHLNQPLFKQQGISYNYSFGANAFGTFYVPIPSISGYTPVALSGYDTNDYTVYFLAAKVEQNRMYIAYKNINASAGGTRTAYFVVLYLRNE